MQNFVLTPADLLTVMGAASITAVILQLLVKPILVNLIEEGKIAERWYGVILNFSTLLLASLFVVLGLVALNDFTRISLVQGVITSVIATSLATSGYEFSKSAGKAIR